MVKKILQTVQVLPLVDIFGRKKSSNEPKVHSSVFMVNARVHKSPHKFMLTSYMKYFAKFLALLLHNTSFLSAKQTYIS